MSQPKGVGRPGTAPPAKLAHNAMYRELLLEIGCEELPAGWLPSLTTQLGERFKVRLSEARVDWKGPVETFSTPRRLTARIAKVADRQADLEQTLTGPPVSAAFGADDQPTPAALGFARKHGVGVRDLTRLEMPKGVYLAYRKRQRGGAAHEVLPAVLAAMLRDLTFPKQMHWDAWLDDGRGELVFGRPIRWILFVRGGRVVPFIIKRADRAQAMEVQPVRSAAVTYGHRFIAESGRPGRAIKVRSFADYRTRLKEHFVLLDRGERRARIARKLDAHARRLGGKVRTAEADSSLLDEVSDLVEYPSVVTGNFPREFLFLPTDVLTTTMIYHQHFFPVVSKNGRLMPSFLAVTNTQRDNTAIIARNAERVLVARLRDAKFFWETDRTVPLESRLGRLDTLLFHRKLGSYREKAERIEALAGRIAKDVLQSPETERWARRAARLAKADLATDMVGEFPELQGVMGGIYAREAGEPEPVWKAISHHYLPVGAEADAPPRRHDLGQAAVSWAAVSLADKLDTLVGLFHAGEQPTGSRDPFGLRRQAHGLFKILVDLPELTGLAIRPSAGSLLDAASAAFGPPSAEQALHKTTFLMDRLRYVLEQRGFDIRNVRAVTHETIDTLRPLDARRKLEVLPEFTETPTFRQLATVFKRVKNIAKELPASEVQETASWRQGAGSSLRETAELALLTEIERREPVIRDVVQSGEDYRRGFAEAARFGPAVDRFFTEVFVMVEDLNLRKARLQLMKRLERLILQLADVSEIVPETE